MAKEEAPQGSVTTRRLFEELGELVRGNNKLLSHPRVASLMERIETDVTAIHAGLVAAGHPTDPFDIPLPRAMVDDLRHEIDQLYIWEEEIVDQTQELDPELQFQEGTRFEDVLRTLHELEILALGDPTVLEHIAEARTRLVELIPPGKTKRESIGSDALPAITRRIYTVLDAMNLRSGRVIPFRQEKAVPRRRPDLDKEKVIPFPGREENHEHVLEHTDAEPLELGEDDESLPGTNLPLQ